jgi:flagellar motility protein MotE (MotC chaperone)
MARGWESKSVEAQVEEAGSGQSSAEKRPLTDIEKTARRERDSLKLSLAYVRHQIESSTNERYTETLRKALREIEEKLKQLQDGPA